MLFIKFIIVSNQKPSGKRLTPIVNNKYLSQLLTDTMAIEVEEAKEAGALGFMCELGLMPTEGRWGNITRLKFQTRKLLGSTIHCNYINKLPVGVVHESMMNLQVADDADLWLQPNNPDQTALFESTVTLTQPFFDEVVEKLCPN